MCKSSTIHPFLFLLICSCDRSRTYNPLLNGHEYKLWYLKTSGNENPQFMYVDCYGSFYTLEIDTQTGFFHSPLNNNELVGKWKYDSEYSIFFDNDLYFIEIGCDTFTYEYNGLTYFPEPEYYNEYIKVVSLINKITNDSIILRDTRLPINSEQYFGEKYYKEYYKKWGKKIKDSPLLGGRDYKIWHIGRKIEYHFYTYYYYDKYGIESLLYLYNNSWYFSNPYDGEIILARNWYQVKDTVYELPCMKFLLIPKSTDTLILKDIGDEYDRLFIDPNLPLKKK